jgi:hypothetical protein
MPTVAISAPTTAGGVQAVLSARMSNNSAVTITNGGTGYTVGNVLTVVGGTGPAIQITVSAVSAGVITSAAITNVGFYSALPTNPVSVTGGTGSSATFTLGTYYFGGAAIVNAGSGYVEQPTVTFSGGGGSGAAAYATVGSGTVIRALGATGTQSLSLFTPGGEVLRLRDRASADSYLLMQADPFAATMRAEGNTNALLFLGANGAGRVIFTTAGSTATPQMQVTHTASAVNFVQVTGAATGNSAGPTISAQGSDSNVPLAIQSKLAAPINFYTSGGFQQFRINNTASAANFLQVTGAAAGVAPVLSAQGNDTNIDLALTPKGTGLVRFGTYTANMALTVQGFIEVKDSGGTIRKLAVIA